MFQVPGELGHTALVLHSGEGTGKNIIVDILVAAFGDHAFVAGKSNDLVGRFNDHLGKAVLVFANEAALGGDKQQEGALKQLITDEKIAVERKYIPTYHTKNCVHVIIASNSDWVAPMGMDDRRFVVLDVSEQKKGDWEYFQGLAEQIKNGGDRAFIHYLLKLVLENEQVIFLYDKIQEHILVLLLKKDMLTFEKVSLVLTGLYKFFQFLSPSY